MKLRKYSDGDWSMVQDALRKLRQARDLLKKVGASKATKKVRMALKSAEGAERHALRIACHARRPELRGESDG